jgi:predicted tellurium resistance membrane protein TerC
MNKSPLPFNKTNYIIMAAGFLLIIIGFVIMANDSEPYGFGFMGLTLGPIIVMSGFIVEFFAITYRSKSKE